MRLTSKGRYAVRAMLDLTIHSNGNPVRLQEISKRQAISLHYLEQLFRKLRTGSVVKSVRGPGGGYVLSRNMDEISIKDVLNSVGENINPAKDIIGVPSSGVEARGENGETLVVNTAEFHLTRDYFQNLGNIMVDYLATTTLGDLMRKAPAQAGSGSGDSLFANITNNNTANNNSNNENTEAKDSQNNTTSSVNRSPFGDIL